jgi:Flp pilus assembly protein TadG
MLAALGVAVTLMSYGAFFISRVYWQYNVLKNATTAGARYLAKGTAAEIKTAARQDEAKALIESLAAQAGMAADHNPIVACSPSLACGGTPTAVIAQADLVIDDPTLALFTDSFTLTVNATVPYPN